MKFIALVVVAFALSIQPLGAAPREITFAATVTSSSGTTVFPPPQLLPAVGTTIHGRIVFDYDPAASAPDSCAGLGAPECMFYSYSTPYTFFLDLGVSQISFPIWQLSVVDDTTALGPEPRDLITLGTKHNNVSYVLTLSGPTSSFTGTDIPPPSVLEDFWTVGVFRVNEMNQTFLVADVGDVSVSSAYDRKIAVLADLQALLPTLAKPNSDKVRSAIEHLRKSLNPKFWAADGDHLTRDGKGAFDEEKKSVHSLEDVVPRSLVIGAINSLVGDDRALAMTAIAESAKGANDIAKAGQEIGMGDADVANGKYEEAVNHYRNAWDLAT